MSGDKCLKNKKGVKCPGDKCLIIKINVKKKKLMLKEDAKEGIDAFINKRNPQWTDK